jgi:hypothetical protein
VQWSTAIVEATLVNVGERVDLAKFEVAAERRLAPKSTHSYWYRLYTFEVTASLDGTIRKGQKVTVARLFGRVDNPIGACSQTITRANVRKSFLLLLRPEAQTPVNTGLLLAKQRDPRNEAFHQAKAFVTVFASLKDEIADDQQAELKRIIATVRKTENGLTDAKVKQACDQLVAAEEEEKVTAARKALLSLGPKAVPAIKKAMEKLDDVGKIRLEKVITDLAPTPLPILMEKMSQTGKDEGHEE